MRDVALIFSIVLVGLFGCRGAKQTTSATADAAATHATVGPRLASIGVTQDGACLLAPNGTPRCWGADWEEHPPPARAGLTGLACEANGCCALDADGRAICWGLAEPAFPAEQRFRKLSFAGHTACGLDLEGRLRCRGKRFTPPAGTSVDLAAYVDGVCALTAGGAVACSDDDAEPTRRQGVALGGGDWHTCLLDRQGEIDCWGTLEEDLRMDAPAGPFLAVAGGGLAACGIRDSGTIECWGRILDSADKPAPISAPPGEFVEVAVGDRSACALRRDGTVACWGRLLTGPDEQAPKGRITGSSCETSGDYVQADVLAAVQAEAAAWTACADRVVSQRDERTGQRVVHGSFAFSWRLVDGVPGDVSEHSAGDGLGCMRPILARLRATAAFSGERRAGRLSCEVSFDDSLP